MDKHKEKLTFTAVLPHTQVDLGHVFTAAIAVGELGNREDVRLDVGDVVSVVAQHPGEGGLPQLRELSWCENSLILIPEPGWVNSHLFIKHIKKKKQEVYQSAFQSR